jgi:hypothetical protein
MEYTQELQRELTIFGGIVRELGQRVDEAGGEPSGFRAVVRELRSAVDQVGRTAFRTLAERTEEWADTVIDDDGKRHRYKHTVDKEWLTIWGQVVVNRRLYQADRGGRCRVPVDERCGMVDRYLTCELERASVFLGAQLPPGEVEEALAEVLLQGPSRTAIQHVLAKVGQCAETHATEVEVALEERAPLDVDGDILVASWDGTTVPLREAAPARGRPPERPGIRESTTAPTSWKEAAVGLVSTYLTPLDPTLEEAERVDVRYFARMPEAKMSTLIDQVATQTAQAQEAGFFLHQVFLADGGRDIWREVNAHAVFDGFTRILDFFHATEHLSLAAEGLFGKSTSKAKHWYGRWRHKLKHEPGAVTALQRSLRYHRKQLKKDSERWREVTSHLGYFRNNQDKMDYATYRAQGLPIGSGPVEAACKTIVKQRLKRSGMRWSREGGQRILNRRVQLQSKRWDAFWYWYLDHTDQLAKAA